MKNRMKVAGVFLAIAVIVAVVILLRGAEVHDQELTISAAERGRCPPGEGAWVMSISETPGEAGGERVEKHLRPLRPPQQAGGQHERRHAAADRPARQARRPIDRGLGGFKAHAFYLGEPGSQSKTRSREDRALFVTAGST